MARPTSQEPKTGLVDAYVRIRPPTDKEADDTELPLFAGDSGGSPLLSSFTGVLGAGDQNCAVFQRCLEPKLATVLSGGAISLFSYGYTGGGKTHTVIGYGEERGLYFLAAQSLLAALHRTTTTTTEKADRPFLRVTACEIYDDRVFDLLGSEKVECTLRVGEDGQLQVVGAAAQSEQLEGAVTEGSGALATLVTRTTSLRSVSVHEPEHLQEIATSCVSQRASGSSTEHAQSSRSHALLRMELTSAAVLEAQAAVDHAKARSGPLRNDLENALALGLSELFNGATGYENCMPVVRILNEIGSHTAVPPPARLLTHCACARARACARACAVFSLTVARVPHCVWCGTAGARPE